MSLSFRFVVVSFGFMVKLVSLKVAQPRVNYKIDDAADLETSEPNLMY